MKTILAGLSAFLCALFLTQPVCAANTPHPLKLGVWPYHSAQYLLNYYEGLRAHLQSRLRQPVQLETAPSVEVFAERMSRGEYDLAIMAPHIGRLAQLDYGWQPVSRYLPDNTVYIVTRKQSGLKSTAQLKNKSIAIPDRSMLLTLAAEKTLAAQGVVEGEIDWQETGGLASSVFAVTSGQADAAVTTLSSLSLTPQVEMDQLKILDNAGKIPQLFLMAAPRLSHYRVRTATVACLGYRRDEKSQMGQLTQAELLAMDGYADRARGLLASHLAPIQPRNGQN